MKCNINIRQGVLGAPFRHLSPKRNLDDANAALSLLGHLELGWGKRPTTATETALGVTTPLATPLRRLAHLVGRGGGGGLGARKCG